MKTKALLTAIALASIMPLALAQTEHQAHHPENTAQGETSQADTTTSAPPMTSPMLQRMEEMQSHWEKLSQTTDPAERQKLMQEHRQKMRELATIMRNMQGNCPGGGQGMMMGSGQGMMGGGQGMMGGGQGMMGGGQGMMGGGQGMMGGMHKMMHGDRHMAMMGMMAAHREMEKRLDLMQVVIEQLLERKE